MLTLFKNGNVYTTDLAGKRDVLTGGKTILSVAKHIDPPKGVEVHIIDCSGQWLIPGLVDAHVHITGGGGEGGPATRMPELQLAMMIEAAAPLPETSAMSTP